MNSSQPLTSEQLDQLIGVQQITVRLDKQLIEQLKAIAARRGTWYKPLIREQLQKLVDSEQDQQKDEE